MSASVVVWALDRTRVTAGDDEVDLDYDIELLRFNRRALRQRGQCTRISTIRRPVEELLGGALTKFVMPARERAMALADLDEMGINARSLYDDLAGAADVATWRILG